MAVLTLVGCSSAPEMQKGPPQFAELMPTAMAPPPPPAQPAPAMQSAPAPPPPMPAGPLYGGHLASYTREADAMRGWNTIVRRHSSIGTLKRYLVQADTPKGRMLRLIAGDFPTLDEAQRFCTWARQQNLYCAVMELGAGGTSAKPVPAAVRRTTPRATPARRATPAPAPGAMPTQPAPSAAPGQPAPSAMPAQPAPSAAPPAAPPMAPARPGSTLPTPPRTSP